MRPLSKTEQLIRRIHALGSTTEELGVADDLETLRICEEERLPDMADAFFEPLYDEIVIRIEEHEHAMVSARHLDPSPVAGLDEGQVHLVDASDGTPVKASFEDGQCNILRHILLSGPTGTGKTFQMVPIAHGAAEAGCHTVILDAHRGFRSIDVMRKRHVFIRWEDPRYNPFDSLSGVNPHIRDHACLRNLAQTYGLKFAEHEGGIVLRSMRDEGQRPNLPDFIGALQFQKYRPGSHRAQYRDSILLILSALLNRTGNLFMCEKGMSIPDLLKSNIVLEIDGMEIQDQAFLIREIFSIAHHLAQVGMRLKNKLLLFIDEAQLLSKHENFSDELVTLRHAGIHLILNIQNISLCPVEWLGNCDALIAFRTIDERDRRIFGKAARLTWEQQDSMATFGERECLWFVPHWKWKSAFKAKTIHLNTSTPDDAELDRKAKEFLSGLSWKPFIVDQEVDAGANAVQAPEKVAVHADAKASPQPTSDTSRQGGNAASGPPTPPPAAASPKAKKPDATERFLRDVLNPDFQFSPMTARFERAGIRSTNEGNAIKKRLEDRGLIRCCAVAVKHGRPPVFTEPTQKLLKEREITWKKTRGKLETRVATEFLEAKLKAFRSLIVNPEGTLEVDGETKQVDLLIWDDDHELVTLEIAGSPDHECHNALYCLRSAEVRKHVVVAIDKAVLKKVKRRFKSHPELTDPRIEILTLSQALKEDWLP